MFAAEKETLSSVERGDGRELCIGLNQELERRLLKIREIRKKELGDKSVEDLAILSILFATENVGEFAEFVAKE